jgi:predicted RNase H-like HicB family nuclease
MSRMYYPVLAKMDYFPRGGRGERTPRLLFHPILVTEMENKNLAYYMSLSYTIQIQHISDESGRYYYAKVLELDGCQSHGYTIEEAYQNIREAMEGWIESKLEWGDPIPEPAADEEYSGKFVLRLPKSFHRELAEQARKENISLNQYILYKLSHSS